MSFPFIFDFVFVWLVVREDPITLSAGTRPQRGRHYRFGGRHTPEDPRGYRTRSFRIALSRPTGLVLANVIEGVEWASTGRRGTRYETTQEPDCEW